MKNKKFLLRMEQDTWEGINALGKKHDLTSTWIINESCKRLLRSGLSTAPTKDNSLDDVRAAAAGMPLDFFRS